MAILVVFLLFGFYAPSARCGDPQGDSVQTITSERYGFSLTWPPGWSNYFQNEAILATDGIAIPSNTNMLVTWEELGVGAVARHTDGSLFIFRQASLDDDDPLLIGHRLRCQTMDAGTKENGIPWTCATPQGLSFTVQRLKTAEENVFQQMFIAHAPYTDRQILVLYLPAQKEDIPMLTSLLHSIEVRPCDFAFPSIYTSNGIASGQVTGRQWYIRLGMERTPMTSGQRTPVSYTHLQRQQLFGRMGQGGRTPGAIEPEIHA